MSSTVFTSKLSHAAHIHKYILFNYCFLIVLFPQTVSSLDSHMATVIMKMLHDASRLGKVVIVSIHQPSSQIFKLLGIHHTLQCIDHTFNLGFYTHH